jgi:putative phosphoesterase
MRILLVADIHANLQALQAIQEPCDACFFLGDLVDYGLEPTPCIDWVRKNATASVRGNHDHGVAQNVTVTGQTGFRYLTSVTRPLTLERITSDDRRFLASLPVTRQITLDETRFLLVHATPRDPLDEYAMADADFWAPRLATVNANVICVGHTHHPYVLEVGNKLVINPGSVGQPRDGDPRASYAVIEDNRVELKRVEYDIEAAIRPIQESTLPETAKLLTVEVLRQGGLAKADASRRQAEPVPRSGGLATTGSESIESSAFDEG